MPRGGGFLFLCFLIFWMRVCFQCAMEEPETRLLYFVNYSSPLFLFFYFLFMILICSTKDHYDYCMWKLEQYRKLTIGEINVITTCS